MWSRHKAYYSVATEPLLKANEKPEEQQLSHMHSLFVTVNSNLCHHIRKYYQGLEATYHSLNNNTSYEARQKFQLPQSFRSVSEDMWPLIITYSQFLQMVDSTFKKPFFATREGQTQGTGTYSTLSI